MWEMWSRYLSGCENVEMWEMREMPACPAEWTGEKWW